MAALAVALNKCRAPGWPGFGEDHVDLEVSRPVRDVGLPVPRSLQEALADTPFSVDVVNISVHERFMSYTKVCLISSLLLTSPIIAWQLWKFLGEGLYASEKKLVRIVAPASAAAFSGGVVFFYFVFLPFVLRFLLTFGLPNIKNMMGHRDYKTLGIYVEHVSKSGGEEIDRLEAEKEEAEKNG